MMYCALLEDDVELIKTMVRYGDMTVERIKTPTDTGSTYMVRIETKRRGAPYCGREVLAQLLNTYNEAPFWAACHSSLIHDDG